MREPVASGRRGWDAATLRSWAVDANDGIIATAGILEGFAGAGAADRVLVTAAAMAMIAGALSLGGTKWAEAAAEREAQLRIAAAEQAELAANPEHEIAELVAHYEAKGLDADLARRVAEQLSAADPLGAQLESEYGIDEVMTVRETVTAGIGAGSAFLVGALIPFLIALFVPALEFWVILATVVVSLIVVSVIAARTGRLSVRRTIVRSLGVGLGTALISYLVGLLLF
ncbi:VIT1/CCC1 transporter family protein [Microbacterium luticocti]|uniref:VIT1/CCC1 transporter family protein n=1 Tax=Microbacterium luticocti TaxID=451764 RepID=UPI0004906B96|nr:VIT1/CCC1 transporter family protein [Microbacterium luticocti]